MAKQSVIAGEYIVQIEDNGHVNVVRVPRNAKATMVKIAEEKGFQYDPAWNTQYFGYALCKEFGDKWSATFDDITITRQKNNKIEIFQECRPVKDALKVICDKMGFEYEPTWGTQYFGFRVVKYLTNNKGDADTVLQTPNMKNCADVASKSQASTPVPSSNESNTDNWERAEENGKYGFKDENGVTVIPCIYDRVGWRWDNGFCSVESGGKKGYINSKGEVVVPIEYDSVDYYAWGNCFIVKKGSWRDGKSGLMDHTGKLLTPIEFTCLAENRDIKLFHAEKDEKHGYLSSSGEAIIPIVNDNVDERWLDGKTLVIKDGASTVIGLNGVVEKVLPYDLFESFDDETGYAAVRRNGKWGYINKELEEVVPCENTYFVLCAIAEVTYDRRLPEIFESPENYCWEDFANDNEELLEDIDSSADEFSEFDEHAITKIFHSEGLAKAINDTFGYEYADNNLANVEEVSLMQIKGENWWDEYREGDFCETFAPNEFTVNYEDEDIAEKGLQYLYTEGSFGYFYRLLIKDVTDFDPSKLVIFNKRDDNGGGDFFVTYDGLRLHYLGDGRCDSEEHFNRRLFIDGEEMDIED